MRRSLGIALACGVIVGSVLLSAIAVPPEPVACPPQPPRAGMSVARRWDDALLAAIRRATPNPPVHARNLFHLSVAMWDAWAAYDTTASGYIFKEKLLACDVNAAREEAISSAAFGVLTSRFANARGAELSLPEFARLRDDLSHTTYTATDEGETAVSVGKRIAAAV